VHRRVGIRIALLVGFAFGAGLLFGRRMGESVPGSFLAPAADTESTAAVRASSTSEALSARPAADRPRGSTRAAAEVVAALPDPSAARRNQVVLDGLHPVLIHVRVTDVDGQAVPEARLTAIPEGATHRAWNAESGATTDALGRADLFVPVAGVYVVLVRAGVRAAVREGVRATQEGPAEVAFVLGRLANLEVRRTGAAENSSWEVCAEGEEPKLADGTVMGRPSCSQSSREDSVVLSLPENVPFRIRVQADEDDRQSAGRTVAEPQTAVMSAPGSLLVRFHAESTADARPAYVNVEVEVAILAETGGLPPSGRVGYTFCERYADSHSEENEGTVDWGPKDAAVSVSHFESTWPPGVAGRVEWTVAGVAGSVEVPAGRAGDQIRLTGAVRIPPAAVETAAGALEVLDERGVPIPFDGPWETGVYLYNQDGAPCDAQGETAEDDVRAWLRDNIGQTVTAERGRWWVSRPGSTTADGTLRLQLELGGYLLVHLPKPLRAGLGRLTVERIDGAYLGMRGGDTHLPSPAEDTGGWGRDGVTNGALVGPLPPGDLGLLFRVGGFEVGRTTARVVAGEVSILTIR
jgi:hypothetical protein